MPVGLKHLIQCHCVLPQYRKMKDPIFHMFTVFSIVNSDNTMFPKIVECNNCGAIHRVVEIGKSEIVIGKDESRSVIRQEDVEHAIPEGVRNVLKKNKVDIATWEEACYIFENQQWDTGITLSREVTGDNVVGKVLRITGKDTYKIEQYTRSLSRDV